MTLAVSSGKISDLFKTPDQPYAGHVQFDCMVKDRSGTKSPGTLLYRSSDGKSMFAATNVFTTDVKLNTPTPTSPRLKATITSFDYAVSQGGYGAQRAPQTITWGEPNQATITSQQRAAVTKQNHEQRRSKQQLSERSNNLRNLQPNNFI